MMRLFLFGVRARSWRDESISFPFQRVFLLLLPRKMTRLSVEVRSDSTTGRGLEIASIGFLRVKLGLLSWVLNYRFKTTQTPTNTRIREWKVTRSASWNKHEGRTSQRRNSKEKMRSEGNAVKLDRREKGMIEVDHRDWDRNCQEI